ncbi:hypothetical protein HC928_10395 [bacterium]|nr:hypothetical protein [bacterium]
MTHGSVAIADLEIGDTVLALNEWTGEVVEEEVTETFVHDDTLLFVQIEGELLETTATHPFLTEGGLWVLAADLQPGMAVLSATGTSGVVEALIPTDRAQRMHNLEVDAVHTYFVGAGQWVVHNCQSGNPLHPDNSNRASSIRNSLNIPYPNYVDPRTNKRVPFPDNPINRVPKDQRANWDSSSERERFIRKWQRDGYPRPQGGWGEYDLHHILPQEFGGTNDFWNLVPVRRSFHQTLFNPWWANFG